MIYPELLAPAGSLEGVRAAVQNGATAIYMGFGTFNARRGAKNFTHDEMAQAIAYCRARGVKTNITLNVLVFDRELEQALADAKFLYQAGADAFIVQDLGLAAALRMHAPEIELHASTQMTVHNVDGARAAKKMGFSRVVLSRECSLDEIASIRREVDIETEVFVHGALCMCYSGQCYFSSVVGRRSGNRGLCAQPCRLPYQCGGKQKYPLSLKDLAAAGHLVGLTQAGVSSLKIEGRMKRPEYAAIVTRIYADLLQEQRAPTKAEVALLTRVFSRDGFTDGYLTGELGDEMFGTKTDVPLSDVQELYTKAANSFAEGKEAPLVALTLDCAITAQGIALTATDDAGNVVTVQDDQPVELARNRPTTTEMVQVNLQKTGGTPFYCTEIKVTLPEGCMVAVARINALRRALLLQMLEIRRQAPKRTWHENVPTTTGGAIAKMQAYTIEVANWAQITPEMLAQKPESLAVPLEALASHLSQAQAYVQAGLRLVAVLPRIYNDNEREKLIKWLKMAKEVGVTQVIAGNLGHFSVANDLQMEVFGGFGLNITNATSLQAVADFGAVRQTLSFELRLEQVRDMVKNCPVELLIYGKLPLMLLENCAIYQAAGKHACKSGPYYLTDRKGAKFPVLPALGCRNTLYNGTALFLPRETYENLGISYAKLLFSDETPAQCTAVWQAICAGKSPEVDATYTRGLYRRGVE